MSVISVINQKGGVGKTTSVANVGAALAQLGFKTLLIDLDPQAHLSISFDLMPSPGDPAVYSVLAGTHSLEDVAQPTGVDNLWVAPTNLDLVGAETEFSTEIGREFLLRDAISKLSEGRFHPDIVLLDCPPSLGLLSLNALVASNGVVIPVQAEFFALQGLAQLEEVIQRVQRRLNPQLDLLGVLVGMFTKQRNLSQEVLQELHNYFGARVFERLVRVNVRLAEAPSHGLTIFQYAPKSGAAEDFTALGREFATRLGLIREVGEMDEAKAGDASAN